MSRELLNVLVVDDDPGDAELLRRALEQVDSIDAIITHVTDSQQACAIIKEHSTDIVFLDYHLGPESGTSVLGKIREQANIRPVIALTGQGSEYVARDMFKNGADDYLNKRDLAPHVLRRSIEGAMSRYHRRRLEALNHDLAIDLKKKNDALEVQNHRLAELYDTAHAFVDNVSHEFRTPLTVIKEFTSILNDGLVGSVTEEQKEYLSTVLDRVDDLSTMVDDMLDISKLEAGLLGVARKFCTIGQILDRVRKTLDRKAAVNKITLYFSEDTGNLALYCDPEKIGRVLINLVINAIKFSGEGGQVRITVQDESSEGLVRMSVIDNGPGIDSEKVSLIFKRFQQLDGAIRSSTKGFGLGLNIAQELVHLSFGDITVASDIGKGSTFSFTVPTADPNRWINRYLDRVTGFRSGIAFVSILNVNLSESASSSARMDAERFIEHQIRKSDLLFPIPGGGWTIMTAGIQSESAALSQRIIHGRAEANRNRPGNPLPAFEISTTGTWSIVHQRQEFASALEKQLAVMETVHA